MRATRIRSGTIIRVQLSNDKWYNLVAISTDPTSKVVRVLSLNTHNRNIFGDPATVEDIVEVLNSGYPVTTLKIDGEEVKDLVVESAVAKIDSTRSVLG